MNRKPISLFFTALTLFVLGLFAQNTFAGAGAICSFCTAPSGSTSSSSRTDNKVYAGLVWTLNHQASYLPDLSIGFRSLKVNSNNDVKGGDLNGRVSFNGGLSFDSFRLVYVGGNRDIQGNLGGGYSFNQKSLLANGAVEGPYIKVGSDFMINDKSFVPYVELNSLSKPRKVENGSLTCPSGSDLTLSNAPIYGNYYVAPSDSSAGYTCVVPQPSDRRLKNNIHLITQLASGLKIYSFKYNWANETYVGVMAQDLLNNKVWKKSVVTMPNGFYGVNYTSLGLKMTTLNNWNKEGLNSIQLH